MFARVAVAAIAGGIIGWERRSSGHLAGIRTMALVGAGSAIFALVSAAGFVDADPARVAAGVATGVGFIGAGTIVVRGGSLHGLTTAAAIWVSAALGLAAGAGMYLLAVTGAIFVTAVLALVPRGLAEGRRRKAGPRVIRGVAGDDYRRSVGPHELDPPPLLPAGRHPASRKSTATLGPVGAAGRRIAADSPGGAPGTALHASTDR